MLTRRTLLVGAATWASVGLHHLYGRRGRSRGQVRLVSWNLRNFNGRTEATSSHALGHDLERLADHLQRLDADVFAFQEVLEPDALAPLLPGYRLEASRTGGAHHQRLVLARRESVSAEPARTHPCTMLTDRLRPILEQRLSLALGEVSVVVVHLKAGRRGHGVRVEQRAALLEHLRSVPRPRLVVGDFNTTGAPDAADEIASLAADFSAADLHRVEPALPCTAYWEGGRYDRYKEASILDHVFVDRASRPAPAVQLAPGTQCTRHACAPLISTDAYPDPDFDGVSDHCPLVVDLSG